MTSFELGILTFQISDEPLSFVPDGRAEIGVDDNFKQRTIRS
jgi:hypothetical protein